MKILLINPPRSPENNILKYAPEAARRFIHKKLIGPPLGLLTVASAVKDHDVVVFDTKGEYDLDPAAPPLPELVKQLMETHRPDVVGVTVITSEFRDAITICRAAKSADPGVITVAGGLHATLLPLDFTDPSVDIVLPGQSAHLFREMILAMERNLPPESIPGLFVRKEGQLISTGRRKGVTNAAGKDYLEVDRGHLKRWIDTYKVGDKVLLKTNYSAMVRLFSAPYVDKLVQPTPEEFLDTLQDDSLIKIPRVLTGI